MSNICNTCSGSNCPANCNGGGGGNKTSSNWIIIVIILVLLGVLLVMAFIVAFDLYKKTQKANEPKNITVNKHIHSIRSPAIVVSAPQIPIPLSQPVAPPITYELRSFQAAPKIPEIRSFRAPEVRSFQAPEIRSFQAPKISTFKMPEMPAFQEADFGVPNNMVSYDGFNLDDVASPMVSALDTPCENR
jgi:flagellar basal body-associated protein FliL